MTRMQENWVERRFIELSRVAFEKDINTYTDFLNLDEQNSLSNISHSEFFTTYQSFGGYKEAERKIIGFEGDSRLDCTSFPITCVCVSPRKVKFSEKLTHRDYLGSILGLGLERSKIGDILVFDDYAYILIHDSMKHFIIENLVQVRNTPVTTAETDIDSSKFIQNFEEVQGTVSSVRLDSVIATVMKDSRSKVIRLIEGGKVFINGRLITTNAYKLNESDLISIRGYGKFKYLGVDSTSKKGRLRITVRKYV